ncbi:peptidase M24 [Clostridium sulfidigenes]|uniref:Peptidase M24 n=1 Tax=Clostridium sulfidigenes TaxID=318464 RepID=A0A084J895_9CLOT|nr:aminopeptidase P family protein [Clostridium sulfidigenes]KEZ85179.1 peptidase M24 [Clostridium sulfidigenes]
MDIKSRIESLRSLMKERSIDAFIIPSSDNHGSEYVSDYFRVRQWISGFTGSAGTVVITEKEAHLWVDGRYFLQGEQQIQGTEYILERMGEPDVKTYTQWICDNVKTGGTVSFNGKVFTVSQLHDLEEAFQEKGIKTKPEEDIFDIIWKDRPTMPNKKIFIHEDSYAGKTVEEKLTLVKEEMKNINVNNLLLASLDDIAWLLNLRGGDVECNPVFLSYFLISDDKYILYVDKEKLNEKIINLLSIKSISIKDYNDIVSDLKLIKGNITFDPSKTNVWLKESINKEVNTIEKRNITTDLKARKNSVELKNIENAHIKDGIAMVKFIKWVKENVNNEEITEISAAEKLKKLRAEGEDFIDISFDTIAGYGPHGAIIHYKASEESSLKLQPKGLFLVDSGAQYLDGTTDITRTIALGELTEEEKEDYTLVLKGHLNLSTAIFLEGTPGCSLDVLARRALWSKGLDFKHGTGHGVGYLLNVHEGPQGIRRELNPIALEEGMIVSNEPGVYKADKHGVRIENLIAVQEKEKNDFGKFMCFKDLTLCPYELDAINISLLNEDEKSWLNDYHKKVLEKLSPYLLEDEVLWLKNATKEI